MLLQTSQHDQQGLNKFPLGSALKNSGHTIQQLKQIVCLIFIFDEYQLSTTKNLQQVFLLVSAYKLFLQSQHRNVGFDLLIFTWLYNGKL